MQHINNLSVVQAALNELHDRARASGISTAKQAAIEGNVTLIENYSLWLDPTPVCDEVQHYSNINLVAKSGCFFSDYCRAIAEAIQYPESSAFLHGLGILASAMMRNFHFIYRNEKKPVNLFVVTAQPPSSGKSGLNNMLLDPIRNEIKRINDDNEFERRRLTKNIAQIEKDLDKETSDNGLRELQARFKTDSEKLESVSYYRHSIDDGTPEAIEDIAGKQGGFFNLISAEATTIEVLLGAIYGSGKSNLNIYLKGWDSEWHSPARIKRDCVEGFYCGCVAVAGQSKSIEQIMKAGESGQGVNERMLMLRERPKLGFRDFNDEKTVPAALSLKYESLVKNIINSDNVKLSFCKDGLESIRNYRQGMESDLRASGKYGNTMIVGFIGKADKQIMKIAAVLHVSINWQDGGKKKTLIDDLMVLRAISIFSELLKSYIGSINSEGYAMGDAQLEDIISKLEDVKAKGRNKITLRDLREKIRNLKSFKGVEALPAKLKTELIPELESRGYLVFDEKSNIYINPKL